MEKIILPEIKDFHKIDIYEKNDGYKALNKALKMQPSEIIDEVKKSGLKGRGGAGFPTGLKWTFMPQKTDKPKYLCVNGDESEPASFKDRQIFEFNPHQLIEGTLIAAFAMGIKTSYIYIRGEYLQWINMFQIALDNAYKKNYIGKNICGTSFSTDIYIHRGAGAYICGEESSLMNSIEGIRPYPRNKPPFPAQNGLWGCPTTINNVETITNIPVILNKGAAWFASIGAPKHPGTLLFGISGHVNKPGIYELPTGTLLTEIIYNYAGGVRENRKIKAVIPGGSSMPIIRGEQIEGLKMDADSLKNIDSAIGTAGIVVMDETTDLVEVLTRITEFYWHESCGQCTPCREGTGWMLKILQRIKNGGGVITDLDLLIEISRNIEGNTVCALGDAAAWPVRYTLQRFRDEFEEYIKKTPKTFQ
jgi:NADH-quinone oxidoreductase subunit F